MSGDTATQRCWLRRSFIYLQAQRMGRYCSPRRLRESTSLDVLSKFARLESESWAAPSPPAAARELTSGLRPLSLRVPLDVVGADRAEAKPPTAAPTE